MFTSSPSDRIDCMLLRDNVLFSKFGWNRYSDEAVYQGRSWSDRFQDIQPDSVDPVNFTLFIETSPHAFFDAEER